MRDGSACCSFERSIRSRCPISVRIALLWSESRLGAFLSGIALHPHAICPAENITREPDNSSGRKYKSELKGEGVPWGAHQIPKRSHFQTRPLTDSN